MKVINGEVGSIGADVVVAYTGCGRETGDYKAIIINSNTVFPSSSSSSSSYSYSYSSFKV
jgi:hypothetical protein